MDHQHTRIDQTGAAQMGQPRMNQMDDDFRADAVMPAQFYPPRRGSAEVEPIMRLMGAILIDAVRCFQNNFEARLPSAQQEFREARFWIFDDKSEEPFSFESVCAALGVDPRGLREAVLRWKSDRRAGTKQRIIRRSPVNIVGQMGFSRSNKNFEL
jgi:hypothetical protein